MQILVYVMKLLFCTPHGGILRWVNGLVFVAFKLKRGLNIIMPLERKDYTLRTE